jgi:hypothetical protein
MPIAIITFPEAVNSSLQLGDIVYYSPTDSVPNSNIQKTTTSNIVKLGSVFSITTDPPTVQVTYDDLPDSTGASTVFPPLATHYVMFEKDKRVNSSSLIGYYADVKLLNNSKKKIELFSLGSEVTESSK